MKKKNKSACVDFLNSPESANYGFLLSWLFRKENINSHYGHFETQPAITHRGPRGE